MLRFLDLETAGENGKRLALVVFSNIHVASIQQHKTFLNQTTDTTINNSFLIEWVLKMFSIGTRGVPYKYTPLPTFLMNEYSNIIYLKTKVKNNFVPILVQNSFYVEKFQIKPNTKRYSLVLVFFSMTNKKNMHFDLDLVGVAKETLICAIHIVPYKFLNVYVFPIGIHIEGT
ncbi:hypothetical protein ACJX0J_023777, partial [Zea mays]